MDNGRHDWLGLENVQRSITGPARGGATPGSCPGRRSPAAAALYREPGAGL
jgi:hypothetical protein